MSKPNKSLKAPKLFVAPREYFTLLLRWLATGILKKISGVELSRGKWITDTIFTILEHSGKRSAIKHCKSLRLEFLGLILKMDKDFNPGVPDHLISRPLRSVVKRLKSGVDNPYGFIRLINSALYVTRYLRLEAVPNHSTIEARPGYTGFPRDLRADMVLFLKELGMNPKRDFGRVPKPLRFRNFHMTSKRGPNGHALWSSFLDAMCLTPEMLESIRVIGGPKLHSLATRLVQLYLIIPSFFDRFVAITGSRTLRKITCIQDLEGKTREVAIGDYFTQAALRPLHHYLFRQLRRINQDCTFDQTKLFSSIKCDKGSSFHSVDLTAATDRFPIAIQKELLDVWFGSEYATH
jgi:hypothetical protein